MTVLALMNIHLIFGIFGSLRRTSQLSVLVMEPDWTAVRQTELHTEICGVFDCEKQIVQLSLHNMNPGTDKNLLNVSHTRRCK